MAPTGKKRESAPNHDKSNDGPAKNHHRSWTPANWNTIPTAPNDKEMAPENANEGDAVSPMKKEKTQETEETQGEETEKNPVNRPMSRAAC